jgi:hypothetical protein
VKILTNLLLIVIVIAAGSFVLAPGVAFFAIRSAADANDAAALSRLIDYAQVRQSLRPQLTGNPAALAPEPSFMEDPIGAVRRRLEQGAVVGPNVDGYLTPAAIGALTRGEGRLAAQRTAAAPDAHNPVPMPVFWSVNRARMKVTDEGGSETLFTFERTGTFEWKMVHVSLPDGSAPVVPPVPRVTKSGKTGG